MSNNLHREFFYSGIVNQTRIVFNGLDCQEVIIHSPDVKINYVGECTWDLVPVIQNEDDIVRLEFLVADTLFAYTELLCLSPPLGRMHLVHWKDQHLWSRRPPHIEFYLDNSEYSCQSWAIVNEYELRKAINYRLTFAEMVILREGVEVYKSTVVSHEDLNDQLSRELQGFEGEGSLILNQVKYQGRDGIEHFIDQVEFKL